jgi:hypothetical protein
LWFLYPLEKQLKFNYTREEYKTAEWLSIQEAAVRIQNKNQKEVIEKLFKTNYYH